MKTRRPSKYDSYVDHPRYGKYPRITGLDPNRDDPNVFVHWNAISPNELGVKIRTILAGDYEFLDYGSRRIPSTAIAAEIKYQQPATVAVTHYYDIEKKCRGCRKAFIFFAVEQKYWYEHLRFPLEADCVRCHNCRKQERVLARCKVDYDGLVNIESPTIDERTRLLECALDLVEHGVFGRKLVERLRGHVKRLPEERKQKYVVRITNLEEAH